MTATTCVVVGGAGAVGSFVADLLRDAGWRVTTCDPVAKPGMNHIVVDATRPSPALVDALASADVVVVSTPEPVALEALPQLTPHMKAGALLLDTASVKADIVRLGAALAVPRFEYVSVNPMFGPSLPASGRPMAAAAVNPGPIWRDVRHAFAMSGIRVVEVEAEAHDRLTAVTQSLTHVLLLAFGATIADLGVDIEQAAEVAPPPFTTMLAMLSRLCAASPDTYWEIQHANGYAATSRATLAAAVRRISECVMDSNTEAFHALVGRISSVLQPISHQHAQLCHDLYARASIDVTPPSPRHAVARHSSAQTTT